MTARRAEALAVAAGGDAGMTDEGAPHALCRTEARIGGDGIEGGFAIGETAAGFVEPRPLHELRRREAGFGGEMPGEAALAHCRLRRESGDRKIGCRILDDPGAKTA
mgnify:FL=1